MKKRVLSGMRPTGKLHIGHWLGTLEKWVSMQKDYECFFMVADLHALTTPTDTDKIKENIHQMVIDWLASGIDVKKSTVFVQSQVPEHAELALLLGMNTPVGWLMRCPTYKEQIRNYPNYQNFGLLGYPVLQAADIAMYKATHVPVGEDQVAHLELTRQIVKKFNSRFGNTFPVPQAVLSPAPKIMGLDRPNNKMSKSFGSQNYIALSDSPEEIKKKLAVAVTDPARKRKTDPGDPKKCNLYSLHQLFSLNKELKKIEAGCESASIGCLDCKIILTKNIADYFADFRKKRKELEKKPKYIKKILDEGYNKASQIAQKTTSEVKKKMGLE